MPYRKPMQARLDKLTSPEPNTGCILWLGKTKSNGYGYITIGPKEFRAHRVIYEFFKGPIPKDLVLDHTCKNTICVNPDHLDPVTQKINLARSNNPIGIKIAKLL
jgi:hypothetical protein